MIFRKVKSFVRTDPSFIIHSIHVFIMRISEHEKFVLITFSTFDVWKIKQNIEKRFCFNLYIITQVALTNLNTETEYLKILFCQSTFYN